MRIFIYLYLIIYPAFVFGLPQNFVYLHDIDPSIQQDIRYAGTHNFVGRTIHGYRSKQCILTKPTALALANIQQQLRSIGLSLKVYDCYRPQQAVSDFITWSQDSNAQQMKNEFYPRIDKAKMFILGYVAEKSGHSRGSTVDLTIVKRNSISAPYQRKKKLTACYSPYQTRYHDNSLDMGTGFDCMDQTAHLDYAQFNKDILNNRHFLMHLMQRNGFKPYEKEWWHFTLLNEPYPHSYFDFVVR